MTAYRQYELDHTPCLWCHLPHQSCICTAESLAELDYVEAMKPEPFVCCRGPFSDLDDTWQRDMMRLCYATTGGCTKADKRNQWDSYAFPTRAQQDRDTQQLIDDEVIRG